MVESRTNNLPVPVEAPFRNKINRALAIRRSEGLSSDYVNISGDNNNKITRRY